MENNREEITRPPERSKIVWTPPSIKISKLWKLRTTFYILLFLAATFIMYRDLVLQPLESIKKLDIASRYLVWTTYKQGITIGYMLCYMLLFVLFLLESTIRKLFYEDEGEVELAGVSKKICRGMGLTALLLAFTIPLVWQ